MNKILKEISIIIKENLKKYLPEVSTQDLEENGKIYYMNDNNGTIFDYYTNNHLSPFMCFYNDKENMGAVKLILDIYGKIEIYLFKNHINKPYKEISTTINVGNNEILELAIIMNKIADNDDKWGASIEDMDSDIKITENKIKEFTSQEEDFRILSELLKTCIVTKKLLDENWKVGLMQKMEPTSEMNSGWFLSVGNETQDYVNNAENLCIITLNELCEKDSVLIPYLMNKEIGDVLIRISNDEFEFDDNKKEIFITKLG